MSEPFKFRDERGFRKSITRNTIPAGERLDTITFRILDRDGLARDSGIKTEAEAVAQAERRLESRTRSLHHRAHHLRLVHPSRGRSSPRQPRACL